MPLNILMTRSESDASQQDSIALAKALTQQGGRVHHCPVFLLTPVPGPLSASSPLKLKGEEDLVFVTRLSVEIFKKSGINLPSTTRCFAVGPGTAETFKHYFPAHPVKYPQSSEDQNSEGLLKLREFESVSGRRIFILRGDSGREYLADELRARGATVEYVTCYERRVNPEFHRFWSQPAPLFVPDVVVLTSTESLRVFLETPRSMEFKDPRVTVLPGRMEALAREYGYSKTIRIESAGNEGIVQGLK